jgi:hypothetical protein
MPRPQDTSTMTPPGRNAARTSVLGQSAQLFAAIMRDLGRSFDDIEAARNS